MKNRKVFGVVMLVCYGAASVFGMFMDNPGFLIGFVVAYGFVDAGFPCVLWTMAAQTVKKPELAGVALGVVSIGFNVGVLLGSPSSAPSWRPPAGMRAPSPTAPHAC